MAASVFSKVIGKLQTRGLIAIGVAVLALVVAVWFLASSNGSAQPKNAAADGSVMVGAKLQVVDGAAIKNGTAANSAPVIEIYTDFSCAGCREFASANDDQMRQWANNGLANLNYHVVVSAAEPKKHDFALRAANADFCALDSQPNKFFDATSALMRMQISAPSFPTDDAIESTLKAAGVQTGGAVHDCIVSKKFESFVTHVTTDSAMGELSQPSVTIGKSVFIAPSFSQNKAADFAAWFLQHVQ